MKEGDYFNNNINDSYKPSLTNSERKRKIKNVDNNISYSDSEEEKNELSININKRGNNSYEGDGFPKKDNYSSQNAIKDNNFNNKMIIYPNYNNYNNNDMNTYNKNNAKKKNLKNNINNINFNRGISEQINLQQKRPTYGVYFTDKKSSGYSDFCLSDKRAFSGKKIIGQIIYFIRQTQEI